MKHKFIYLFGIMILFIGSNNFAQSTESLIEVGNQYYAAGDYQVASETYEQILASGLESHVLYYNLGNSYYKLNQISLAILNYERALLINPGDDDTKYNLSLANQLIADRIEPLPEFFLVKWWNALGNNLSGNAWALSAIFLFTTSLIFIFLFVIIRRQVFRRISVPVIAVAMILSIFSLSFAVKKANRLTKHETAIVFSPSVTIKSSPDTSGTDLFVLHEGIKVQILEEVSDWYEIQLADGNKGWIPTESVELI